eukprot:scaffold83243_cov18-Tisochrysis_lutea.AAC.1
MIISARGTFFGGATIGALCPSRKLHGQGTCAVLDCQRQVSHEGEGEGCSKPLYRVAFWGSAVKDCCFSLAGS